MSRNTGVPNAWDDDWETQADKAAAQETKQPQIKKLLSRGAGAGTGRHSGSVAVAEEEEPQMTRAERLAKHEEENRRIWNSAYVCLFISPSLPLYFPKTKEKHLSGTSS